MFRSWCCIIKCWLLLYAKDRRSHVTKEIKGLSPPHASPPSKTLLVPEQLICKNNVQLIRASITWMVSRRERCSWSPVIIDLSPLKQTIVSLSTFLPPYIRSTPPLQLSNFNSPTITTSLNASCYSFFCQLSNTSCTFSLHNTSKESKLLHRAHAKVDFTITFPTTKVRSPLIQRWP